jgi:hypothetical protein
MWYKIIDPRKKGLGKEITEQLKTKPAAGCGIGAPNL